LRSRSCIIDGEAVACGEDGIASFEHLGWKDGLRAPEALIAEGKADVFFTCGSNRLLKLMQRLGKKHDIPGQVATEQIMVCGFGACYVCVRTFEVDGKRVLKRVCRDGPVFNMQEAVAW
jgi:dihydroorotate dehydrogenase electron transfer subunit